MDPTAWCFCSPVGLADPWDEGHTQAFPKSLILFLCKEAVHRRTHSSTTHWCMERDAVHQRTEQLRGWTKQAQFFLGNSQFNFRSFVSKKVINCSCFDLLWRPGTKVVLSELQSNLLWNGAGRQNFLQLPNNFMVIGHWLQSPPAGIHTFLWCSSVIK